MNKTVSILIPNYNGRALLQRNLPSVIKAVKCYHAETEIIIADDASTDDSCDFIKNNYPQIIVLENAKNVGFSGNVNRAIKRAKFKLVLLLNTDVSISEDYIERLSVHMDDDSVFGVAGKICSENNQLMDAAKYPILKYGNLTCTLNYIAGDAILPTLFLSGANAIYDTHKLKLLNGFDERYNPFYFEDVDISIRAWRMGWKCFFIPDAVCYHQLSSTINSTFKTKRVKIIAQKNKMLLHYTHLDAMQKYFWQLKIFFNLMFRWIIADFNYYNSYLLFLNAKKYKSAHLKFNKTLSQTIAEIITASSKIKKTFF